MTINAENITFESKEPSVIKPRACESKQTKTELEKNTEDEYADTTHSCLRRKTKKHYI